jgi:acetoin utilization deacetylase AcuC-like enzyme
MVTPDLSSPRNARAESGPAAKTTGFLYGDIYLKHHTGPGHPERPERLTAIVERFQQKGLQLVPLKPAPAALEWITAVHAREYIERVKRDCQSGVGYVDTSDAPVSSDSYEAAVAAVGGVLGAVDAVMDGRIRNAFCAVRPPGHHSLTNHAMGFCLFNNVAIAARYIQQKHKLAKVLIVDWDVHHGNGTQAIFYQDPTVFYFSIHQSPFYPGTGSAKETGEGRGAGFTLNVPFPAGCGDAEYKKAVEEKLKPAAAAFKPDFVLISAGFDACKGDLLGQMQVTPEGYAALTRVVKGIAEQYCHGRLVSILEGGYYLEGLAASAEAHVRVLME